MPDNDRMPRRARAVWKEPLRLAWAADEPLRVGDASGAAMARVLREDGGCPGVRELAQQARDAALFQTGDFPEAGDRFVDRAGRRPLAFKMRDEAQFLLATRPGDLAAMSDDEAAREIAVAGLRTHVQGEMWSRGRERVIDRFGSADAADAYERRCLDGTPVEALADALLRRPDGAGLRAPDRRAVDPDTAALLEEDFGS